MSLADTQKLTAMVNSIPSQIAAATSGLGAIQSQIDNLSAQKSAVTDITNTTTAGVTTELVDTVVAAQGGDGISYGANYGSVSQTGNLTDWAVTKLGVPIYSYTPGDYPDIDVSSGDFDFSADLLTKPFPSIDDIASGAAATYGIDAKLSLLNKGKSIMENNLTKLEGATDVFDRYAT